MTRTSSWNPWRTSCFGQSLRTDAVARTPAHTRCQSRACPSRRRPRMSAPPAIHVGRDRFHLAWDPAIPAIETVGDGDEVEFDLLDASNGTLPPDTHVDEIATLDFSGVDQVNGPIAIDRAVAGDTLQVELLDFQPADWGWTASIPGLRLAP